MHFCDCLASYDLAVLLLSRKGKNNNAVTYSWLKSQKCIACGARCLKPDANVTSKRN